MAYIHTGKSINEATPEEWDKLSSPNTPQQVKKSYPEAINPSYYKKGIETIDYIESKDMCYLEGNVVKYISRYKEKNGVEDLRKCAWYLEKLIERTVKGDKK
jgi:hypothetical protein